MTVAIDTNVVVYRHDPRDPRKQSQAEHLLRAAVATGDARLPFQTVAEFVSATTQTRRDRPRLLDPESAARECARLRDQFEMLFPDAEQLDLALEGAIAHGLSWYDALMWSYAERWGCDVLWSEDFVHGRTYGRVTVVNPFVAAPT